MILSAVLPSLSLFSVSFFIFASYIGNMERQLHRVSIFSFVS
jgi:hypothetical protein